MPMIVGKNCQPPRPNATHYGAGGPGAVKRQLNVSNKKLEFGGGPMDQLSTNFPK